MTDLAARARTDRALGISLFTIALFLSFTSNVARAQNPFNAWATPIKVNEVSESSGTNKMGNIQAASDGGFHITYINNSSQVKYRHYNPTTGLAPGVVIDNGGTNYNATVAEATNGDIHVAFEDWTSIPNVGWAKSTNGGLSFSPSTKISNGGNETKWPTLSAQGTGSNGNIMLNFYNPTTDQLLYNRYDGSNWGGSTTQGNSTTTEYFVQYRTTARNPVDGSVIMAWADGPEHNRSVKVARWNGSNWGFPVTAATGVEFPSRLSVAVNDTGQTMVLFDSDNKTFSTLANTWNGTYSGATVVNNFSLFGNVVAVPGSNEFYAITNFHNNGVVGRRYIPELGGWQPYFEANVAISPWNLGFSPTIRATISADRKIYVGWEDWDVDFNGSSDYGQIWMTQQTYKTKDWAITYKGNVNNQWEMGAWTQNWVGDGESVSYYQLRTLTFDDSRVNASDQVVLAQSYFQSPNGPLTPGSVTVNNTTKNYEFTTATAVTWSGSGGLTKQGTGTLTVSVVANYTGNTQIQNGTVIVNSPQGLGGSGSQTFLGNTSGANNAALLIAGAYTLDRAITVQNDGNALSTRTLGGTNTSGTATYSNNIGINKALTLTAAGGGTVDFNAALNNAGGSAITKAGAGTVQFKGNNVFGSGTALKIEAGAVNAVGTNALSSNLNVQLASGTTLRVMSGTPTIKNVRGLSGGLGTVQVDSGASMTLAPGSAVNHQVRSLSIAGGATPTGKLNLTNGSLLVDYSGASPISTIRSQVISGFAGGAWNGNGINSSSAAADSSTFGVGFAEVTELGILSYSDPQGGSDGVDPTTVILKFTYVGDANLDGTVDGDDYFAFFGNLGSGTDWSQGDFDYNGTVDGDDYFALFGNLGNSGLGDIIAASAVGITPVPEPSSLALALLAASALASRIVIGRRRTPVA